MQRDFCYAHCECGVLVRVQRMPADGSDASDSMKQLANAGGVAYGGVCPSKTCEAAMTVTIIPKVDKAPRVQLLTAQ